MYLPAIFQHIELCRAKHCSNKLAILKDLGGFCKDEIYRQTATMDTAADV